MPSNHLLQSICIIRQQQFESELKIKSDNLASISDNHYHYFNLIFEYLFIPFPHSENVILTSTRTVSNAEIKWSVIGWCWANGPMRILLLHIAKLTIDFMLHRLYSCFQVKSAVWHVLLNKLWELNEIWCFPCMKNQIKNDQIKGPILKI